MSVFAACNIYPPPPLRNEKRFNDEKILFVDAGRHPCFDKSKTVLKAAAEAGKSFIWGAQPFKIRWHQVNGTSNPADDFIYEAKW